MIKVEVLYAGLSKSSTPLEEADRISTSEVLGIVVKDDTQVGKLQNIAMCSGFDKYALCQRVNAGQPQIMLIGWDDGDFVWRRLSNPHDIDARQEVNMPIGCLHIVFEGQQVDADVWAEAEKILYEEML
jgi:hypothetical protein